MWRKLPPRLSELLLYFQGTSLRTTRLLFSPDLCFLYFFVFHSCMVAFGLSIRQATNPTTVGLTVVVPFLGVCACACACACACLINWLNDWLTDRRLAARRAFLILFVTSSFQLNCLIRSFSFSPAPRVACGQPQQHVATPPKLNTKLSTQSLSNAFAWARKALYAKRMRRAKRVGDRLRDRARERAYALFCFDI